MKNTRACAVGLLLAFATGLGCLSPSSPGASSALGLEESFIFHPTRYPEGNWDTKRLAVEDAWFEASDGVRLHGWFAAPARPRAVILYCHGNAGCVADGPGILEFFRDQLQASILVFDYRGFGRSAGSPTEAGVLLDARAARRWLAQRTGVTEQDIVLVGRSLGGGVAVDLAAKEGARGLILENTFTAVPDVANHYLPLLPWRAFLHTRLDSLALIGQYHGPLLQTHGDADGTIPFDLGRKLFEAANQPKEFVSVPGGGHNDGPRRAYLTALHRFLNTLPPQGGR